MERTQLLGRELSYLFSFDMPLVTEASAGDVSGPFYATRVHSLAPGASEGAKVYNALGEQRTLGEPAIRGHVQLADQRVEYPAGLEYALLQGRLVICTDAGDVLEASYTGSVSAEDRWQLLVARHSAAHPRMPERFETKAFIATRFDTASTRCRWLVKCMCLGYGRVSFGKPGQPAHASFDIYTMAS